MENVALKAARVEGLNHWDGLCLELVDYLLRSHPQGEILWVEPQSGPWKYHAVMVLDGIVHDAWHPDVMLPPAEYVQVVFGPHAPWEMNPGGSTSGGCP